ncbi:MAG: hypothetical protein H6837_09460 [Planctomycetes bacterium]|nr:hypothetical protein [Planctomycetota bacterium]
MAILTRRTVLIALGSVALGACLFPLPNSRTEVETPSPFSHAVHVGQQKLECRLCHHSMIEGETPTMPGPQVCRVCHAKVDQNKAPVHRLAAYFGGDAQFRRARTNAPHGDVHFSHRHHGSAAKLSCADCHGDVSTRKGLPPTVTAKATCMGCHAERGASNDCATCHAVIRKDIRPTSHDVGWEKRHGAVVRARSAPDSGRCTLCHSESRDCNTCHHEQRPRDHTLYFRRRGHGLCASIDRSRCATCHTSNSCDRCHQTTRPLSHNAGWAGTSQGHCVGCHFPLRGEGCHVCHKSTPSHALATPLPSGHNPAANCRMCHGVSAPLPHPDNATSCTACHR